MVASPTEGRVDPDGLTACVISWNTQVLTLRCVESLHHVAGVPQDRILVVDSASTDRTCQAVSSRFPGVRIMALSENLGYAHACNAGMQACETPLVALLNADLEVFRESLALASRSLERCVPAGAAGLYLVDPWGRWDHGWEAFPGRFWRVLPWGAYRWYERVTGRNRLMDFGPIRTDWVGGGGMVIRRKAWLDVGPMDEGFHMYCEETDWCWRASKKGWIILGLPEAQALHWGGQSSMQRPGAMYAVLFASKLRLLQKHAPESVRMLRASFFPQWGMAWAQGIRSSNPSRRLRSQAAWRLMVGTPMKGWLAEVDQEITAPPKKSSVETPPSPWSTVLLCSGDHAGPILPAMEAWGDQKALPITETLLVGETPLGLGPIEEGGVGSPPLRLLACRVGEGWPGMVNRAVSQVTGKWMALMDSRVVLPRNALRGMRRFAEDHPEAGAVGPRWGVAGQAGDRPRLWTVDLPGSDSLLARWKDRLGLAPWRDPEPVSLLYGACLLFRVDAWRAAGGLDEQYVSPLALADLFGRMKGMGWTLTRLPWVRATMKGMESAGLPTDDQAWMKDRIRLTEKTHRRPL